MKIFVTSVIMKTRRMETRTSRRMEKGYMWANQHAHYTRGPRNTTQTRTTDLKIAIWLNIGSQTIKNSLPLHPSGLKSFRLSKTL